MPELQLLKERIANGLDFRGINYSVIKMMGGTCFMVDEKMCIGTHRNKASGEAIIIARVGKDDYDSSLEIQGASAFDFTGRPLTGFVQVNLESIQNDDQLQFWIDKCLAFNPLAKKSKKKKTKS